LRASGSFRSFPKAKKFFRGVRNGLEVFPGGL
jgi:hypothetical protein